METNVTGSSSRTYRFMTLTQAFPSLRTLPPYLVYGVGVDKAGNNGVLRYPGTPGNPVIVAAREMTGATLTRDMLAGSTLCLNSAHQW